MIDGQKSVHLLIEGRVQGVGFRAWVDMTARGVGLTGWVRNRRDGAVEAMLAGPTAVVDDAVLRCATGPTSARVDRVQILATGTEAFAAFVVRPTV